MSDEITVNPSDVVFLQKLKEGQFSAVFKVLVDDKTCILKVYRDRGSFEVNNPDLEVNLFVCESTAYRRLKSKGLCERGVIPDFYGVITKIQSALWPSLDMFLNDKLPPNAVLIEYIPDARQIDISNYSRKRLLQFRQILDDIHQAKVLHADPKPRNMVVSATQDRVLWIDFDSSQTFPEDTPLSERQKSWFDFEVEMVDYFVEGLAKDYEEGKLNVTYSYYYDWFQ